MQDNIILGVDIGGTGIKAALVDINTGELLTERFRMLTPQPATPEAIAQTFADIVKQFEWTGSIGCGFPAIMRKGTAHSASNIDKAWIGTNVEELLSKASDCPVFVANDADVAGMAEMQFGVGKGQQGTVFLITIGTGIGSAMFVDGKLIPNTELGHLYMRKQKEIVERWASNSVRKKEALEWNVWGKRFNQYLEHLAHLFSPDLFILGGGVSKKFEKFAPYLDGNTKVIPAELLNNAGLIGAAVYAKMVRQTAETQCLVSE